MPAGKPISPTRRITSTVSKSELPGFSSDGLRMPKARSFLPASEAQRALSSGLGNFASSVLARSRSPGHARIGDELLDVEQGQIPQRALLVARLGDQGVGQLLARRRRPKGNTSTARRPWGSCRPTRR